MPRLSEDRIGNRLENKARWADRKRGVEGANHRRPGLAAPAADLTGRARLANRPAPLGRHPPDLAPCSDILRLALRPSASLSRTRYFVFGDDSQLLKWPSRAARWRALAMMAADLPGAAGFETSFSTCSEAQ